MASLSLLQEDLPNPGIEPRSSTLQADSLPAEPSGKAPQSAVLPQKPGRDKKLSHGSLPGREEVRNILVNPPNFSCSRGTTGHPASASVTCNLSLA